MGICKSKPDYTTYKIGTWNLLPNVRCSSCLLITLCAVSSCSCIRCCYCSECFTVGSQYNSYRNWNPCTKCKVILYHPTTDAFKAFYSPRIVA